MQKWKSDLYANCFIVKCINYSRQLEGKAGDHHKKTGDRVIGLQPLRLASGRYDIAEASSCINQLLYQSVGDDRSQLNVSVNEKSPV
jgi:hypothetical protein